LDGAINFTANDYVYLTW